MRPSTYRRATEAFLAAVQVAPEQQRAYLEQLCAGDRSTLRAALDLLRGDLGDDAEFDDEHGVELPVSELPAPRDLLSAPESPRIAGFRLLDVLGSGASGIVYRAHQETLDREIALKLLHPGAQSDQVARRFALEAHMLGRLDHPGIVRIFETGSYETAVGSRPFIAMELVEGAPISVACERQQLELRARWELLAQLADAVRHAHQRGVLHRDLKPANVLVTEDGRVRVLDFGIARPMESGLGITALDGESGAVVGTLGFMSPEQLSGAAGDVDMRSDIYALGAIAYQLLAGKPAFEAGSEGGQDALRRLVDRDPLPLGKLDPRLRGDAEAVVGKAMASDKSQRYGSAASFAADIRRLLAGKAVHARRAGWLERGRRTIRTHRVASALVLGLFTTLVVGWVTQVSANADLIAEADRQRRLDTAMMRFINQPLAESGVIPGQEKFLDRWLAAEPWIEENLANDVALAGSFYYHAGRRIHSLALNEDQREQGRAYVTKAVELLSPALGATHPHTLAARKALVSATLGRFDVDHAREMIESLFRDSTDVCATDGVFRASLAILRHWFLKQDGRRQEAFDFLLHEIEAVGAMGEYPEMIAAMRLILLTQLPEAEAFAELEELRPQLPKFGRRNILKFQRAESLLMARRADELGLPSAWQEAMASFLSTSEEAAAAFGSSARNVELLDAHIERLLHEEPLALEAMSNLRPSRTSAAPWLRSARSQEQVDS